MSDANNNASTINTRLAYLEGLYDEIATLRSMAVANGDTAEVAALDGDRKEIDRWWAEAIEPQARAA